MQIVVPASELRAYPSKEETQTKWLPSPPSGWFSVVSIFITKRGVENKWPGYENGAKPIGVIITKDRIVWAVCAQNPIDEQTESVIEEYRVRLASLPGAAEAPREPNIRAILWGFQEEHERFFVELAWSDASQSS